MTSPTASKDTVVRYTLIVLLLVGFAVRAQQYLFDRSLWLDETMLALNIVGRTFGQLTAPLDYNQGAPLGFLFIQKLMVTLFGNRDYILTLFPFLASTASLCLFYRVVRITLPHLGQIVATGLFSISSFLVYYASECKQYSSDVMACLLLLEGTLRCLRREADRKDFILLGGAGVLACWLSHPALFVLCGSVVVLLFWQRERLLPVMTVLAAWLVNVLLLYLVSYRQLAANPVLTGYWKSFFMPMPPWENPGWFADTAMLIFRRPVDLPLPWVAPLVVLAGLCLIRNRPLLTIICTSLGTTLLASGLEKYPFGDRLLLFAVPMFFLCIGAAVGALESLGESKALRAAQVVLAVLVLAWPVLQAVNYVASPFNKEDLKTVLEQIQQKKTGRDSLYVYTGAVPAFDFYARQYGLEKMNTIRGQNHRNSPQEYAAEIAGLKGHERVWFIFSHNYNWGGYDEEAYIESLLSRTGTKLDEARSDDAVALLYQIR